MGKIGFAHVSFGLGLVSAILSGCADKEALRQAAAARITQTELLSYCPPVEFEDGSAFYNVYAAGGQGKADKIVYQAVISDLTRSCQYPQGYLTMKVAAAGRIVPGPAFRATRLTMPINVKVVRGRQVLSSRVYRHGVADDQSNGARQFVFNDDTISIPRAEAEGARVYIGFALKPRKADMPDYE